MLCEKCQSQLNYGDKYCNVCGEKINKSVYEPEYNKTVWGWIDKGIDWYKTLSLKKFTDNWIFKIAILVAIALFGILDTYTDLTHIILIPSESYNIEYNRKLDEYYIRTNEPEVTLQLYIPNRTETLTTKEYKDEAVISEKSFTKDTYIKTPVTLKKNTFDYATLDSKKGEKTSDTIKLYLMD